MPTTPNTRHRVEIPGLAEAIAAVPVDDKHKQLLQAVRQFEPLHAAKLATTRDEGGRLVRRSVLDAAGEVIHKDHREWLRLELEADAGDAATTRARLRGKGYLLSVCNFVSVYLVHDRGGPSQDNFLQVNLLMEDEHVDLEMFSSDSWRDAPKNLRDLVDAAEEGYGVEEGRRRRLRPSAYSLEKVVDVARFVEDAEALETARRAKYKGARYALSDSYTGVLEKVVTIDELSPDWDRYPGKAKRLFDDWAASSAGRSGARICEHWVMKTTDWTSDNGERSMELIPMWTFDKKMAEIPSHKGSEYELFGKLEKLDQRTKVPFAWFFFMLHGNRVMDGAGRRILEAAENGLIVLPEHDYRVLKAWRTKPYGF